MDIATVLYKLAKNPNTPTAGVRTGRPKDNFQGHLSYIRNSHSPTACLIRLPIDTQFSILNNPYHEQRPVFDVSVLLGEVNWGQEKIFWVCECLGVI